MATPDILSVNGGLGRRIAALEVEGTEGSAEASPVNVAVEELKVTPQATYTPVNVVSPEQPGHRGVSTLNHHVVSIASHWYTTTVSAADGTDAPQAGKILQGSGWNRTGDATDKTYTFVLTSAQESTLTVREVQENANNTRYITTEAVGVRGNTKISARAGEPVRLAFDGMGTIGGAGGAASPREATGSAWSGTINFPTTLPLIFDGATIQIYDIDNTTLYSGGSLGSPGTDLMVLGFEFDSKRNPALRTGASATRGVQGVTLNPGTAQLVLDLEYSANKNINLSALQASTAPVMVRIRIPSRDLATDVWTLLCWGVISALDDTQVADNRYVAKVTLDVVYPPDVSDNSPPAGTSPTQAIGAATNYGLPLMPTATLPKGNAWIQVVSA